MKTSSKKLDKCQVRLSVALDEGEMNSVVREVENVFMREAQMPGFRKGKVPIALIRKEFAGGLKQETERRMIRRHYPDAVKAEKLDEIALADVQDVVVGASGGSFVAIVEVKPEFKLPAYKGLKIESRDVTVKDGDVEAQIDRLRMNYATFEDAKEGESVSDGDFVQIDYSGTVGKKPILEIAPEAKMVAGAQGFWTQVEEGRFLPEILEALKGMKVGESKEDVKVKFDKDAAPEGLKGEKAVYTISLKAFRRRIPAPDATLVEKLGVASIEELEKKTRESMEKMAVEQESIRRENEAVELLMKKVDFDVPASQVMHAMDAYLNELAQRAQYSGLDASYFEQNRDKIRKDAEEAATRRVRLWYVLDAIAKAENIDAKDDERGKKVVELILANAKK